MLGLGKHRYNLTDTCAGREFILVQLMRFLSQNQFKFGVILCARTSFL